MHHVFAYLDPGSGSLLIQGAIATGVAAVFVGRQKITAGMRSVRRMGRRDPAESTPTATPAPTTTPPTKE